MGSETMFFLRDARCRLLALAMVPLVSGCPKAMVIHPDGGTDLDAALVDAGPADAGCTDLCPPEVIGGDPARALGLDALYGLAELDGQLFGTNWYQITGLVYRLPVEGNPDDSVTFTAKAPFAFDGSFGGSPEGRSAPCSASPMATDGASAIFFGIFRQDAGCPAPGIYELRSDGTVLRNLVSLWTSNVHAIAADANYVYYSEFTDFGGGNQTGLFRVDRPTGANPTRFLNAAIIDAILVDGGFLYFVDRADGTINRASADSIAAAAPIASGTAPMAILRADESYIYYEDSGQFYRVDKTGAALAEDITPPGGLLRAPLYDVLVDDTYVYYVAGPTGDQAIYAFRKDLSSPSVRLLASIESDRVSATAQDATAIYWTTAGTGPFAAIWRLRKPAP